MNNSNIEARTFFVLRSRKIGKRKDDSGKTCQFEV